ncbi:MAG: M20/M25/M40 family metallo-hydrolase, partial [Thiohalomonadales bacterium]
QTLGDKNFNRGLKKLYSQQSFKVTSFSDLNKIFSSITKSEKKSSVDSKWIDLMFTQWTQRVGAPKLEISNYKVKIEGDSFRLTALLTQTQAEDVFEIDVPIAVHLEGQDKAFQTEIRMNSRKQNISLKLAAKPLKLEVDPEFDIFRRLDTNEIPPSINQVFGADSVLIVLPAKAPKKIREAYMKLAKSWQVRQQSKIKISYDKDITSLPKDRAVWLLGWENEFRDYLNTTLDVYPYSTNQDNIKIVEENFTKQDFSVVVVSRHQDSNKFAFSWLATNNIKALPGLGRKLPHYGKYSYLAFMGDEPVIKFKGQWPVVNSPMTVVLTDKKLIKSGVLKKRTALATLPPAFSQNRILKDIRILSDSKFTGRGLGTSGLDQAAHYIQKQFKDAGLLPGQFQDEKKSTRYFQQWQTSISEKPETKKLQNVIGIIPGSDPDLKAESLVIGAHYDHLGLGWPDVHKGDEGKIHHGANDNASGVAVMLELARLLKKGPAPKRSIIFVAFTGEEAGRLGSEYYLKHSGNYPVNKMIAMINLDTVGRLEQKPLIVFGNNTAREWVHIFRGVSYVTGVDIKPVDNDPAASDHTSFIEAGVPAIHLFTGVNLDYHRPTDTINKIDGTGLIKVATVLKETIDYLAERTEFLNSNLTRAGQSNKNKSKSKTMKRRVSLGTVPDFQYSGKGVRIDAVTAGSPAELAQLQKGDIVVQMNKVEILNLRDFSDILRKLKPGDNIDISVLRAGKIHKVSTHVVAR